MEVKRKELKNDATRQQELAAYFTNCKLQKVHMRLVLTSAMGLCFKGGNYATAANFARMLLDNGPNEAQAKKARQVLQACGDRKDAHQLNYDFRNPFVVCGATFVPIYRGQKDVSCPYCASRFVPSSIDRGLMRLR
uniref:Coatomer alpha subunit C-terminal domain-containing protein n=1 Tax=Aegilops tauschii subsp. strangulata TaxID=200361 RepID=A0A453JAE7_AEGTS